MNGNNKLILKASKLTKRFGGVVALDRVSFKVFKGECHAIVGENGAGKTTLINILSGAILPDSGYFEFDGKEYEHLDPKKSLSLGLNVIHQDLALVETMNVKENIFLSNLQGNFSGIVRNQRELKKEAEKILSLLDSKIDPNIFVEDLSTAQKQVIEIAKALAFESKLLIMDEPTASLTQMETEKLFEIIKVLKKRGIAIIFISHRLEEVFKISDRVTVLRDGRYIDTVLTKKTKTNEIIRMMVGREVELYKRMVGGETKGKIVLKVDTLTKKPFFKEVSFCAKSGEILCFAGLVGSGRTELAQTIFGALSPDKGEIKVFGKSIQIKSPKDAMELGIGLLPEDRKLAGIISTMVVRENISIAALPKLSNLSIVKRKKENEIVNKFIKLLNIKTPSTETFIFNLSGGNQQKVVLARWLATNVKILIVDEPTQGIDVGAKSEIHKLLKELSDRGVAIIVISSDLPEVLSVSDRILVMRSGKLVGELKSSEATEEKIMTLAALD